MCSPLACSLPSSTPGVQVSIGEDDVAAKVSENGLNVLQISWPQLAVHRICKANLNAGLWVDPKLEVSRLEKGDELPRQESPLLG